MNPRFTELTRIPVTIAAKRARGALVPEWNDDRLVLRADVPLRTNAPVGVNVDSLVLMDALDDGTIFEVELLAPRRAWKRSRAAPEPPFAVESGSLVLTDPGPSIFVSSLAPKFGVDRRLRLHVELEPITPDTSWISVSESCFALLNAGFLAGFVVDVPPNLRR